MIHSYGGQVAAEAAMGQEKQSVWLGVQIAGKSFNEAYWFHLACCHSETLKRLLVGGNLMGTFISNITYKPI